MCVNACVWMYTYECVHVHLCTSEYACVCECMCVHAHMCECVCVRVWVEGCWAQDDFLPEEPYLSGVSAVEVHCPAGVVRSPRGHTAALKFLSR